ncbi:RidA family protein [Mesorhizobium sp. 1M-11]|uniref:RidA family protein n=1 Tax=Mesorhizobium sp. 1M-11 TaxID=1529006 RepID=UPI0006C76AF0|nr:RidA family protein [Mesorhizobium sp. 1M-11]
MPGLYETRLIELGMTMPEAPIAAANYIPFKLCGNVLYLAGQVPRLNGKSAYLGILGRDIGLEDAQKAARICGLNVLSQIKAALGDLDRVSSVIRLVGYVASTPDFRELHLVMNGASDLMVEIFGEAGKHARTSVGVAALPQGVPVEVEATIEIRHSRSFRRISA